MDPEATRPADSGDPFDLPPPEEKKDPASGPAADRGKLQPARLPGRTTGARRASAVPTSSPPRKKGRAAKKFLVLAVPLAIVGLIAAMCIKKTPSGDVVMVALGKKLGEVFGLREPGPRVVRTRPELVKTELDQRYDFALAERLSAEIYVKGQVVPAQEKLDALTAEDVGRIVAELEKWEARLRAGQGALETVVIETNKLEGTSLSNADNIQANRDLQEYQQFAKQLRAALADWKGHLAKKTGKPVEAAPVAVAAYNPKFYHPWARAQAETWVRARITVGDTVTFQDIVVKARTEDGLTFAREVMVDGKLSEDRTWEERFVPEGFQAGEEEPILVGDLEVKCLRVEFGAEKRWIARSGRWTNRVAIRIAKGGKETAVTKLGEEPLPFKDRQYSCIAYEMGGTKYWAHEDFPGFVLKSQSQQVTYEVVDWGVSLAKRPPMPKPPEPIVLPKAPHPWGSFKPGAWVREKTGEAVRDLLLDAVDEASAVLKIEFVRDGVAVGEVRAHALKPAASKAVREEKIGVGGDEQDCVVVEYPGGGRAWLPRKGRAVLFTPLRVDDGATAWAVIELAEANLAIGDREVNCLRVKLEGKKAEKMVREEIWYSEAVPGFEARRLTVEGGGAEEKSTLREVLAFGDDASKRPPLLAKKPDPPKPPPPPVEQVLAEADRLAVEGSAIFGEVAGRMAKLPDDAEKLKALHARNEAAAALFVRAREAYLAARERAPESAGVPAKLERIGKIEALLQNYADRIKSEMK